jgi:hypothetical protein
MKFRKKIFYISIGTISSGLGICIGLASYVNWKSKQNWKTKLNVVFDLDETIIYTNKIGYYNDANKLNLSSPELYEIIGNRKIWIRPYANTIIPILSTFNNLFLFTKATEPYTTDILMKTNLDKYFKEKKYREDCKGTCKDYEKFESIKNIKNTTVLVDDKISNQCGGQNFYHIPKFNHCVKNDKEMIKLFFYILWLNIKTDMCTNTYIKK